MADDQEAISTVEPDGSPETWDGVTYEVFAAERQCLPEDFEGRMQVATAAIGAPWRAYALHDGRCPILVGGQLPMRAGELFQQWTLDCRGRHVPFGPRHLPTALALLPCLLADVHIPLLFVSAADATLVAPEVLGPMLEGQLPQSANRCLLALLEGLVVAVDRLRCVFSSQ